MFIYDICAKVQMPTSSLFLHGKIESYIYMAMIFWKFKYAQIKLQMLEGM